jgi:hypothetical protein
MTMTPAVVMRITFFGIGRDLIAIPIDMGQGLIRRRHLDARNTLGRMRNRAKPQGKG